MESWREGRGREREYGEGRGEIEEEFHGDLTKPRKVLNRLEEAFSERCLLNPSSEGTRERHSVLENENEIACNHRQQHYATRLH